MAIPVDPSKLGIFNQIYNPNGNGIVRLQEDSNALLASGGNYVWWRVGARLVSQIGRGIKRLFTGTTENDRARTQLLRNVAEAVGVGKLREERQDVAVDRGGRIVLNDALLDALERLLDPDVFRREDFQLKGGQVISGSPLTERRVTKICQKVKELEGPGAVANELQPLDQVIERQQRIYLRLAQSLMQDENLEAIIRMVLYDPNAVKKASLNRYKTSSGSALAKDIENDIRAIATAITIQNSHSACAKAINSYNEHIRKIDPNFVIGGAYLKRCLRVLNVQADDCTGDTVCGFLHLLHCAREKRAGTRDGNNVRVKFGDLEGGVAHPADQVFRIAQLRSRWPEACKNTILPDSAAAQTPSAMKIAAALSGDSKYEIIKWGIRRIAFLRFQCSGIASPLSNDDILGLAEDLGAKLQSYFSEKKGEKTEPDCIKFLCKNLGEEAENGVRVFNLSDGRQLELTKEVVQEMFYSMFDGAVSRLLDEKAKDFSDSGLNQTIERTFTVNVKGESHALTSVITPAQGQNAVTNLATSELKDDRGNSLVKFVRFGQRMLYKNKLDKEGRPPELTSEAEKKAYYTRIVEEMLRTNKAKVLKKKEGGTTSYTVPLYQIDMCGVQTDFLKDLTSFDCSIKKSLLGQDVSPAPDTPQTITVEVHRFHVPADSEGSMSKEDVIYLSKQLNELLDAAIDKLGDPKINALHQSLVAYKENVLDPLVKEGQPLSLAGRGGELMQLGSQVAMLACLLGHTPAIHCNMGKDRTGLMDARIKQLATTLKYAPDAPIKVKSSDEFTDDKKRLNTEFVLKTGNNEAAKCMDQFTESRGINLDQSHGVSKLYSEYQCETVKKPGGGAFHVFHIKPYDSKKPIELAGGDQP